MAFNKHNILFNIRNTPYRYIALCGWLIALQFHSDAYAVLTPHPSSFVMTQQVLNQNKSTLTHAFQESLRSLLILWSGDSDIQNHSEIMQALKNPERYVSRYAYDRIEPNEIAIGVQKSPPLRFILQIAFDIQLTTNLLRKVQAPVWLGARPPILLLFPKVKRMASKQEQEEQEQEQEQEQESTDSTLIHLNSLIQHRFSQWHIKTILPAHRELQFTDTEDTESDHNILGQEKIDALSPEKASKIATRYQCGALLTTDLHQDHHLQWTGSVTLYFNGKKRTQTIHTKTEDALAETMTHFSIKVLSSYYGQQNTVTQHTTLCMQNVHHWKQCRDIMNHLTKLAFVTHVVPLKINASEMTLQIQGNITQLIQHLSMNPHFTISPSTHHLPPYSSKQNIPLLHQKIHIPPSTSEDYHYVFLWQPDVSSLL